VVGLLLNVGSGFAMASANIVARKAQHADTDYDPLQFVVWMSLVPIIPFGVLAWFSEPAATHWHWMQASLFGWCSVAFLGWFATIAAYGFWTDLLKRHPANRVSPFGLGVPVVGLAAGMLALGERVTAWQWAGSAFVIAALVTVMSTPNAMTPLPQKEPAD
jgi:O-acetylserine/cysteine efflux transporter